MVVSCVRKGDKQAGLADGGDFGNGGGACPADDQIGATVFPGHVINKGADIRLDSGIVVGLLNI